jgi:anhydro-N-acetylmuramic acid kinase
MSHPLDLPPAQVLGVMSGTSLDGIDAVLAAFERSDGRYRWRVIDRERSDFPVELRERLQRAIVPGGADVVEIAMLHAEVGEAYADVAERVAARATIDLIALSGQTLYHIPHPDPSRGLRSRATLQIGEAARVAERCRIAVVSDLRQGDFAAGGHGAPLVPFGDLHLFGAPGVRRAIHNLGGISNVTYLPANGDPDDVLAFDTGPANCLMDEAMTQAFGRAYDHAGEVAARGRIEPRLLTDLLRHPYLTAPPPKTTGREEFNLRDLLPNPSPLAPEDLLATLCAYTARTIGDAYRRFVLPRGLDEIHLAGGGALNPTLVAAIRAELPDIHVVTFEEIGYRSLDREPLAFALMGYAALHRVPNTIRSATGARRAVISGRILTP